MMDAAEVLTKTELIYRQLIEYATLYGFKLLAAIAVLFVGFSVANRLSKWGEIALTRKDIDPTIGVYLARILNAAFKIVIVITAAGVLGVETTSFIALLGAAGLAVGLALQGSLSNFAGGVLILILRPFRVGDFIKAQGQDGVVSAIDIFHTTLTRTDNQRVVIPNGPLIGDVIVNVSLEKVRRVEVSVGVAYDSDIDKVEEVLLRIAKESPLVQQDPPPFVGISGFGDSSVNLVFRVWCLSAEFWDVHYDMHRKTKKALDAAGIVIPFPQREVRILNPK